MNTQPPSCEVCAILPANQPIFETENWMVSLSPDQGHLGRCYVTLKRHEDDLANLTDEDWREFSRVLKQTQAAIRAAFGARLFNWGCLMNNAFQSETPCPHIHWHLRPRYDTEVEVNGVEFTDPQFGYHYDRAQVNIVDAETLDGIRRAILSARELE